MQISHSISGSVACSAAAAAGLHPWHVLARPVFRKEHFSHNHSASFAAAPTAASGSSSCTLLLATPDATFCCKGPASSSLDQLGCSLSSITSDA